MSLDVVTASSDVDLTTTSAVKEYLGTTTTGDDALISSLVRRVSRRAEQYVGYPLSAAAYLETVPSYGGRRLVLARTPVRAITGLFQGTDSGDYLQVNSSDFAVDAEAGFIERLTGFEWSVPVDGDLVLHPMVGQEYPLWRVEYVAGYTRGGIDTGSALWSTVKGTTSTGRTLPDDIEDAVIAKVGAVQSGEDGVVARSVGDLRIQYGTNAAGGAQDAFSQLAGYARTA